MSRTGAMAWKQIFACVREPRILGE